jgi:hypothetical protein
MRLPAIRAILKKAPPPCFEQKNFSDTSRKYSAHKSAYFVSHLFQNFEHFLNFNLSSSAFDLLRTQSSLYCPNHS